MHTLCHSKENQIYAYVLYVHKILMKHFVYFLIITTFLFYIINVHLKSNIMKVLSIHFQFSGQYRFETVLTNINSLCGFTFSSHRSC